MSRISKKNVIALNNKMREIINNLDNAATYDEEGYEEAKLEAAGGSEFLEVVCTELRYLSTLGAHGLNDHEVAVLTNCLVLNKSRAARMAKDGANMEAVRHLYAGKVNAGNLAEKLISNVVERNDVDNVPRRGGHAMEPLAREEA